MAQDHHPYKKQHDLLKIVTRVVVSEFIQFENENLLKIVNFINVFVIFYVITCKFFYVITASLLMSIYPQGLHMWSFGDQRFLVYAAIKHYQNKFRAVYLY